MTSLDFIIENLQSSKWEYTPWPERRKIIQHAKDMHKQEIIDAFDNGVEDDGYIDNAEQYYQETFKKK